MINTNDILQTIHMIDQQHLDVRTITMGVSLLAQHNINILDITQTVLQEFFTMVILVDTSACQQSIGEMSDILEQAGKEQDLSIRIQREDIFNAMHRI